MSPYTGTASLIVTAALCLATLQPVHATANKVASGLGQDLAQRLCTQCHAVEPGQASAPEHVRGPSFQSIADRPGITRASLRKHLRETHSNAMIPLAMPNPQLTNDELVKIIAYLVALKTPEPSPHK